MFKIPGSAGTAKLPLMVAVLATFVLPAAWSEESGDGARSSVSREIASGGRDGKAGEAIRHAYPALETAGERKKPSRNGQASAKASAKSASDFWFYTADVQLFNDDDGDGYYHGIDLLFDADTIYDVADVYAVAYLSYEGGPWNEYAVTRDFTINGATSDDEYVIVTELETGFPSGEYDLLIELYDAWDGAFLAEFGPADTSALSYLPLEDFERDDPFRDEIVVVGSRGGGAALGLLPLAFMLWRRAKLRFHEPSA